ncbi:hypothetical protein ACFV9C_42440 [Kribbella sp. NPDC059898]|uniref:hypothetical protein n=1 Tax=Kribbella sp. NPDC059898 TaxID=3346995 RepID=UPI00364633FC
MTTHTRNTARFGPQAREIVAVLDRLPALTGDELRDLHVAHQQVWGYGTETPPLNGPTSKSWLALRQALDRAGRVAWPALGVVFETTRTEIIAAGAGVGQFAIRDAVMALSARDLVGTVTEWDQATYDALLWPWRTVVRA